MSNSIVDTYRQIMSKPHSISHTHTHTHTHTHNLLAVPLSKKFNNSPN